MDMSFIAEQSFNRCYVGEVKETLNYKQLVKDNLAQSAKTMACIWAIKPTVTSIVGEALFTPLDSIARSFTSKTARGIEKPIVDYYIDPTEYPRLNTVVKAVAGFTIGYKSSEWIVEKGHHQDGINSIIYDAFPLTNIAYNNTKLFDTTIFVAETLDPLFKNGELVYTDFIASGGRALLLDACINAIDYGLEVVNNNVACVTCQTSEAFDMAWDTAADLLYNI